MQYQGESTTPAINPRCKSDGCDWVSSLLPWKYLPQSWNSSYINTEQPWPLQLFRNEPDKDLMSEYKKSKERDQLQWLMGYMVKLCTQSSPIYFHLLSIFQYFFALNLIAGQSGLLLQTVLKHPWRKLIENLLPGSTAVTVTLYWAFSESNFLIWPIVLRQPELSQRSKRTKHPWAQIAPWLLNLSHVHCSHRQTVRKNATGWPHTGTPSVALRACVCV